VVDPVRAPVALLAALVPAFALGLVLVPDPTGAGPVLAGLLLTVILAPVLYVGLGRIAGD
jgi:hypothetical protein